ncbi:hypothetical protein ACRAWD_30965 [Caulobacter segnis]
MLGIQYGGRRQGQPPAAGTCRGAPWREPARRSIPNGSPRPSNQGAVFGVENVTLTQSADADPYAHGERHDDQGRPAPGPGARLLAACSVDAELIYGPPIALQPLAVATARRHGRRGGARQQCSPSRC